MEFLVSKELALKGGIYIIKSKTTNDSYIGQCINFRKRRNNHVYDLNNRLHIHGLADHVVNYGISDLIFEVLEVVDNLSLLNQIEKQYILNGKPTLNKSFSDGNYHSNKTIELMKKNQINSKVVIQYEPNGDFVKEWRNARDIEKETGLSNSNISKCCTGKLKFIGGYKWAYK